MKIHPTPKLHPNIRNHFVTLYNIYSSKIEKTVDSMITFQCVGERGIGNVRKLTDLT